MMSPSPYLLAIVLSCALLRAQGAELYDIHGQWLYDQAGHSVSGVGDVDGEGFAESNFIWTWTTTDADGMATRGFDLPSWPSLVGLPMNAQWGCLDAAANPLGATTSDALEMVFGQ